MGLTCDCDDFDHPSVYREEYRRAKKQHRCSECSRTIQSGETYQYIFGVWDNEVSQYRTCEACSDLRDSMSAAGFCITLGELRHEHAEYINIFKPKTLTSRSLVKWTSKTK